ncbi:MAG: outer membrane protein TolC [Granulosicoccus sp.]|jgi:outer membrane protein TolC
MKNIILAILIIFGFNLSAQNVLTLEQAKTTTLANNFGIKIAKNNVVIAQNQTDISVNGYLPTVSANAGLNGNFGGSTQTFGNGNEASTANAFTWGGNATVQANYTIFDKGRDLTLEQLKESLSLSNLQLKQTIEQNLLQVYNGYFQVAQLSENVNALLEAISISRERLRRAQYQLDFGQGSGLDVLNAQVDIQRDSVNLLNTKMNLENAKRNLNVSMGRNTNEDFQVEIDTAIDKSLNLESLIEQSKNENIGLQVNRKNLAVNEMNLQIIDAEKRPTISAGASYAFSYSDNPTGAFIDKSNSRGLAANVGVNWTIYDGSRGIRMQNAVINLTNQKLQIDQLQQQLEGDIMNAWANYQNALFVLQVEENAVETNRENFDRTEEQVKIGRLTSIEFRQAQLNLLNAQTSINNAKFDTKLREIQLLQLVGRLID